MHHLIKARTALCMCMAMGSVQVASPFAARAEAYFDDARDGLIRDCRGTIL